MNRFKSPVPVGSPLLSGGQEIADRIGLSRRKTYYLIKTGRIGPVFRIGGRKVYCCPAALSQWLADEMTAGRIARSPALR